MPFNVALCVQYVEELIRQEELERALLVLDNVPAEQRMVQPPELMQLRRDILLRCETARDIQNAPEDILDSDTAKLLMQGTLRGQLLYMEVRQHNEAGRIPHLVDYGPGGYFVPTGLRALQCSFTYWDVACNSKAQAEARPGIPELKAEADHGRPTVFVGLEVLEHMHEPRDLAVEALRHCGERGPDSVHLSTPMCTYSEFPITEDWRTTRTMHHLRAYTPQEFLLAANALFPGYHWAMHTPSELHTQPMSAVGRKS